MTRDTRTNRQAGCSRSSPGRGRRGTPTRSASRWFSPGEKHWHGAAPTTAMTHVAIQEKLDGKPVDWLEHVTSEQYEGRSGGR